MPSSNDEFSVGELLSGPIRAIQEAQIAAEREVMDFILTYGMEEVQQKVGQKTITVYQLRTLEFDMKKAVSDPASPGRTVENTMKVTAPLLSIIQPPSLRIDEATIDLALDVSISKESFPNASKSKVAQKKAALLPGIRTSAVLKGVVGNGAVSRSFRTKGRLNVSLKLRSSQDDEQQSRLTRIVSEGLATHIELSDK